MRFLLKPGWIAFVLLVIGFVVACYTQLAPWQFRRNAEQQQLNHAVAASFTHPPRPLAELVPSGTPSRDVEWRQATVHGAYLPNDEVLVRLRTILGEPGFEVMTAFRTDDGRVIAVERGFVRPGQGSHVAPFPKSPAGPVALIGRIRLDESDSERRPPFLLDGRHQIYAADSRMLAQVIAQPVTSGRLVLVDDQPGVLGVMPLPASDDGPFLSYAWQWLSFGAMALFGLVYFIRLELLQRRDPGARPRWESYPKEPVEPKKPVDPLVERYGKARF